VRAGSLPTQDFHEIEKQLSCGPGACNVMGTASTMNAVSEALGMMPPGFSTLPVADPVRMARAEAAGERIVALVRQDVRPSALMTTAAFDNAVRVLLALGGSTNAVIHLLAIAGRLRVPLTLDRFDELSREVPCVADVQPAGRALIDELHAAGGIPAVMKRIEPWLDLGATTVVGKSWREVLADVGEPAGAVVRSPEQPVAAAPTLAIVRGSLAPAGAVIKVAAASPALLRHRGRAVVFDSYDELLARIDDPRLEITADDVLVLRNAGPRGACGMPEWGMLPIPKRLQQQGVRDMLRISDARMSGTSFGTVVLHVAPEAAVGGPLALVQTGDVIELDVDGRRLDLHVAEAELTERRARWQPPASPHLRGWPRLYLDQVLQADEGCDLEFLRPRSAEAARFVPPVVGRS
jgi:dihydroxy-acid dehydratase